MLLSMETVNIILFELLVKSCVKSEMAFYNIFLAQAYIIGHVLNVQLARNRIAYNYIACNGSITRCNFVACNKVAPCDSTFRWH